MVGDEYVVLVGGSGRNVQLGAGFILATVRPEGCAQVVGSARVPGWAVGIEIIITM